VQASMGLWDEPNPATRCAMTITPN